MIISCPRRRCGCEPKCIRFCCALPRGQFLNHSCRKDSHGSSFAGLKRSSRSRAKSISHLARISIRGSSVLEHYAYLMTTPSLPEQSRHFTLIKTTRLSPIAQAASLYTRTSAESAAFSRKGWVQHTTIGRGMWHSEINNRPHEYMRCIQILASMALSKERAWLPIMRTAQLGLRSK